jgi:hypothetical protein
MLVADDRRRDGFAIGSGMDCKSILRVPRFMPGLGVSVMSVVLMGVFKEI